MSSYLRKCIDIAPTGVITPGAANDYRLLRNAPWWPALRATTSHLRLWADWPSLQPDPSQPPGAGVSAPNLAALDGQVKAASDDGMQVILLPYRYPRWANETATIVGGSKQDSDFFPEDRVSRLSAYQRWLAGTAIRPTYKALQYRLPPEGHGPESAWGRFVAWLWDRYVANADRFGRAAYFETVNEPNLQLWPQRTGVDSTDVAARFGIEATHLVVTEAVADMMATMDGLARAHGGAAICLAPSTSDSDTDDVPRATTIACRSPYATTDDPFADSLLAALQRRGFSGGDGWVWSYHNYSDVERDQRHVVYLRQALVAGGWNGRQLDGGPEVHCTEGGCRLSGVRARFGRTLAPDEQRRFQARVLTESLSRHHFAKGAGAGVGMLCQYTTYADINFDDGLLEAAGFGGAPRPALAAWSAVPEYVPPVAPRADWRPQP